MTNDPRNAEDPLLPDLLAAEQRRHDDLVERVHGALAGDEFMPDGVPINERTIGRLMAQHRDQIEAWLDTHGGVE